MEAWHVLAAVCAVLFTHFAYHRWRLVSKARSLPFVNAPISFPLGQLQQAIKERARVPGTDKPDLWTYWTEEIAPQFWDKGLFCFWAFHPVVPVSNAIAVILDPALAKQILDRRMDRPPYFKKGAMYKFVKPLFGTQSVLVLPTDDEWQFQRTVAETGFRLPTLELATDTVNLVMEQALFPRLDAVCSRGAAPVEVTTLCKHAGLEVIALVAFGCDFHSFTDTDASLGKAFDTVVDTFVQNSRRLPLLRWLPTPTNMRFAIALRRINNAAKKVMQQRERAARAGSRVASRPDLLSALLQRGEGGERLMTSDRVLSAIKTFLFAGHDTTAWALSWALYLLAQHPEHQERLQAEVSAHMAKAGRTAPGLTDFDSMPFMGAVISEVLRMYPSAGFTREALQDVQVGKYTIPKGVNIYIFPSLLHRFPGSWPRPQEFDPDRWLRPGEKHGYYIPFSAGPRNCIGQRLALVEMKTALLRLVMRYKFSPAEGAPPPRIMVKLTMVPTPFSLTVERR